MRVVAVIVADAGPADAAALHAIREAMATPGQIVVRPRLFLPTIADRVGFETGVHRAELTGPSRGARPARARFAVAWLAKRRGDFSLRQIAWALGRTDHTSALNMIRRADALRAIDAHSQRVVDPAFRRLTDRLAAEFEEQFQ